MRVAIFLFGLAAGIVSALVLNNISMVGTRNECRAANPGYDCNMGWVKDGPFK